MIALLFVKDHPSIWAELGTQETWMRFDSLHAWTIIKIINVAAAWFSLYQIDHATPLLIKATKNSTDDFSRKMPFKTLFKDSTNDLWKMD